MTRTCACEPDAGDDRFTRECDYCDTASMSTHCPHDEFQEPCPECDVLPVAQFA